MTLKQLAGVGLTFAILMILAVVIWGCGPAQQSRSSVSPVDAPRNFHEQTFGTITRDAQQGG